LFVDFAHQVSNAVFHVSLFAQEKNKSDLQAMRVQKGQFESFTLPVSSSTCTVPTNLVRNLTQVVWVAFWL
jgi:hypothetical protein